MLIFVLPTENCLVVSLWIFFKYTSQQPKQIRKKNTESFCWCRGICL